MKGLLIALATLAAPAFAQAPAPASALAPAPAAAVTPAPKPATVKVTLTTSEGPILIEVETQRAPITAGNFLRYVDQKRMDNTSFYRASKVPNMPELGLVQGGVRYDPKKVLPPIRHEPTTQTGLKHTDGTISMGRNTPGTAAGDFFIIVGDMPYMDADPSQPGDNAGYAAFGHVVEGMDLVKRIMAAPISPTAGEGIMKGEMLAQPVKILTARRTP
jgi:peptidyl-prolyl cis-trans isomerase A (cyclophilin A)